MDEHRDPSESTPTTGGLKPRKYSADTGYEGAGAALAVGLVPLTVVISVICSDPVIDAPPSLGSYMLMLFGLTQFIYIAPLSWWFYRRGKTQTARGLLSMAGVIFLLNSGCWGYLFVVGNLATR